ncbi:MAG: hypothetical protein KDK41_13740 [Leptospiraceae bacterium]|nr:hypothetical protein [Leptospiraceae bacterium]
MLNRFEYGKFRETARILKPLWLLHFFEREPEKYFTCLQLKSALFDLDINISERQISRILNSFSVHSTVFEYSGHARRLSSAIPVSLVALGILAELKNKANLRNILQGGIDAALQSRYLVSNRDFILNLITLLHCICVQRIVSFDYLPQTSETRKKIKRNVRAGKIQANKDVLKIECLPRFIVFRGDKILLLAEIWYRGERECRSYELQGIDKTKSGEPLQPLLNLNAEIIYENSLRTWISGPVLEVTLLDLGRPAGAGQLRQIKVNGLDEILEDLIAARGLKKIIDPDLQLMNRARERGLRFEEIFEFRSSSSSSTGNESL